MGDKTKIDWCDASWNPVTGCLHGCEYCHARELTRSFGGRWDNDLQRTVSADGSIHDIDRPLMRHTKGKNRDICVHNVQAPFPFGFDPTFHRYRLDIPARWKRPRNIFVCSMADLFGDWVPDAWIQEVFAACEAAPQHRYLFLTKNPTRLGKMATAYKVREYNDLYVDNPHPHTAKYQNVPPLPTHDNWWFGSTLDNADARRFQGGFDWNTFTSIEPLTEHMNMGLGSFGSDRWTIIGAETGNRKGKVIPKREWVENILEAAALTGMKVFMKESLRPLMGEDFRQEYPWEVKLK